MNNEIKNNGPSRPKPWRKRMAWLLIGSLLSPAGLFNFSPVARAQVIPVPPSLKTVAVPEPPELDNYVRDKAAAIRLGKALFWDLQVGSDGETACASCHFHAGADNRAKNQIGPGLLGGDQTFQKARPNSTLKAADFPFHQRFSPSDRQSSGVSANTNDIVSSQGVPLVLYTGITKGSRLDQGSPLADPVFQVGGVNVRRVEPRNTPSVINAVFNLHNFWDGRAHRVFNGQNPFGSADDQATILVNGDGQLKPVKLRLDFASLASQAVGPVLSDFEMSFQGRTWPEVGRKLLSLQPLGRQVIHPQDSVLGPLSIRTKALGSRVSGMPGLRTTYARMIQEAFPSKYWNSNQVVTLGAPKIQGPTLDNPRTFARLVGPARISKAAKGPLGAGQYTQMEANFAFFFGVALQLYQATLVANDSKFDRVQEGRATFTPQEQEGLNIFMNEGRCIQCHGGPVLTNASTALLGVEGLVERMGMVQGEAFYDVGFYNVAATPTTEDKGRGGNDPFGRPLSYSLRGLEKNTTGTVVPDDLLPYIPDLPGCQPFPAPCNLNRVAVNGAFKTPGLRNVELTGPYFHNGGAATLMQVVEFYARGGNFPQENVDDLNPFVAEIGFIQGNLSRKRALVAFLLTLTDERVRQERAPFDHPQLFIPNGHDEGLPGLPDQMLELPAVGTGGRPAAGLPPIQTFLGLDPFLP
ncbi:MAG: cytochrome C peroxidase [Deltaproteobacteria bacterium]|nr:cytochrome C peroxidase [Deltaproteobacteria bacterium]